MKTLVKGTPSVAFFVDADCSIDVRGLFTLYGTGYLHREFFVQLLYCSLGNDFVPK